MGVDGIEIMLDHRQNRSAIRSNTHGTEQAAHAGLTQFNLSAPYLVCGPFRMSHRNLQKWERQPIAFAVCCRSRDASYLSDQHATAQITMEQIRRSGGN